MKKSYWFMIVCLTALSIIIAGCGSNNNNGDSTSTSSGESTNTSSDKTPEPKKDVTITVTSGQDWIKDIDRKLAEQFTQETGIKVDFQVNPTDQYYSILKTKLATHEAADIIYMDAGVKMEDFQPEKNLLDLSNEPWVSRLQPWAKEGSSVNGKLYGLNTWSVDSWSFLYNTAIFDKYGLEAPKSYAEFVKVCETLLANGVIPIYENAKDVWHLPNWLLTLTGAAELENPDVVKQLNANEAKFADSEMMKTALTQFSELNEKGFFGENVLANDWDKGFEALASGKYAMYLGYTTYQNTVLEKFPDSGADKWRMFPNPLADNTKAALTAGGIVRTVNIESKHLEEVRQYFEFLTTQENLEAYYIEREDLGQAAFVDVEVAELTEGFNSLKANSSSEGVSMDQSVKYIDSAGLGKSMQDLLIGATTPEEILKQLDESRDKTFKVVAN